MLLSLSSPNQFKALKISPFFAGDIASCSKKNKMVLISMDIDDTYEPSAGGNKINTKAMQRNQEALNIPKIVSQGYLLYNSGRPFWDFKDDAYWLAQNPVEAIGSSDGTHVSFNPHDQKNLNSESGSNRQKLRQKTEDWIKTQQVDEKWQTVKDQWIANGLAHDVKTLIEHMQTGQKDPKSALRIARSNISLQDFTFIMPYKGSNKLSRWEFKQYVDKESGQQVIELKPANNKILTPKEQQVAQKFSTVLKQHLQPIWSEVKIENEFSSPSPRIRIYPKYSSKAVVAEYVASQLNPPPKAIIHCGDAFNDHSILSRTQIGDFPVFGIYITNPFSMRKTIEINIDSEARHANRAFKSLKDRHPSNMVIVPSTKLPEALFSQWKKITDEDVN